MTTTLRVCILAYMITTLATVALIFGVIVQSWHDPAIEYMEWVYSQPSDAFHQAISYIGGIMLVASWVGAVALFFGKAWARWIFTIALGVAYLFQVVLFLEGQPPQLFSNLEILLDSASGLLSGLIIGLSFASRSGGINPAL